MDQGTPKIRFDQATAVYGHNEPAVKDLSLEIPEGSFTVFVGPSGCGKTTSLRMINRMVVPRTGSVYLNGQDVQEGPAHILRRNIGYVMQSAGLMPHRTVLKNILTVPSLMGKADPVRAKELMELVGLDPEMAPRYPSQLSGGQQQRVGVARALAVDPDVVLMDEPFSAVDPVVRADLQQEVLRLQRELKKTFVMVTHDIDEALMLGTKIAVFGPGGRLAQYDTPQNILRQPADDFVANFVGKDRGFRALSWENGEGLRARSLDDAGGWRLDLDQERKPRGWFSPEGEHHAGGSLYPQGESMRLALDSALSSPSGYGVVIDDQGRAVGLLRARDILDSTDTHSS